ncbi:hypothetical protein EC988_003711, partial [Linderina pennispora]
IIDCLVIVSLAFNTIVLLMIAHGDIKPERRICRSPFVDETSYPVHDDDSSIRLRCWNI